MPRCTTQPSGEARTPIRPKQGQGRCPRSATVEALEDTKLLCLTKETFRKILTGKPELAERIVTILAKRLLHANSIITDLEGEKRSLEIIYKTR